MKPRSHSLNHVVCVTITAIEVEPTIRVATKAMTWRERLVNDIRGSATSESLSDAEMDADAALLRFAVDQQSFDRIELVADVEARRSDRRLIAEARADGIEQIAEVEVLRLAPDVAEIKERDRAELACQRQAHLRRSLEHRQAADRKSLR